MTPQSVFEIMLYVAAGVQIAAAVSALCLIPLSGKRWFWILISTGLAIQAYRRLYLVLDPHGPATARDAFSSLAISILLFVGIIGIRSLFISYRRTHNELRAERLRSTQYLNVANAIIVIWDCDGRIEYLNRQAREKLGRELDEARGQNWFETFVPEHLRREVSDGFQRLMSATEGDDYVEYAVIDAKGEEHDVVWHRRVMHDEAGRALGVRCAGIDTTDRRRVQEELAFRSLLLDKTTDCVIVADLDGKVVYVNDATCALTGARREQLLDSDIRRLCSKETGFQFDTSVRVLRSEGAATIESSVTAADGRAVPLELHAHLIREGSDQLVVMVGRDVAERKEAEEAIRHIAYHDTLTGLPNRALLSDRAEMMLAQAARYRKECTVAFLDVDNLKHVNDTLGHAVADELLMIVAERLRRLFRKGDTVARLGGDEFVILLEHTGRVAAVKAAEKLLKKVREPIEIAGTAVAPSVSVGLAVYPDDGTDFEVLMRNSDDAMYAVKHSGRNGFCFYRPEMRAPQRNGDGLAGARQVRRSRVATAPDRST